MNMFTSFALSARPAGPSSRRSERYKKQTLKSKKRKVGKKERGSKVCVEIEYGTEDPSALPRYRPYVHRVVLEWERQDGLVLDTLAYLDVSDVLKLKCVNKRWQDLCTFTIKHNFMPKVKFEDSASLRKAVVDYCKPTSRSMNLLGKTVGFPIGKWNVSEIEDFDMVFKDQALFNEDIISWNVSTKIQT